MQGVWWHDGPSEAYAQLEMIAFSVDPQWCGLLFSVYCRHEKGALLGGGSIPQADAFATCSLAGPPLDADWIAIAGSLGFEICRLSSTWALILESVKATGVILFLGIGSLVCYRIYTRYRPRNRPRPGFRRHSREWNDENGGQFVEDIADENPDELEGRYFGPTQGTSSLSVDRSYPCSRSASGSIYPNSSASQSDSGEDQDTDEHQNVFESRRQPLDATNSGWLVGKMSKIVSAIPVNVELPGNAWLRQSPSPGLRERRLISGYITTLDSKHLVPDHAETIQLRDTSWTQNFNSSEGSYDSLGFRKSLPHDHSFDSTCSELSLPETTLVMDNGTMLCMDKLQQEIGKVKTDCLDIDKDFATIKCNRNLPGMSSLISGDTSNALEELDAESTKEETARACFAGLYSLTKINNSPSSDSFSNSIRGLGHNGSFGSAESLVWDSPLMGASPAKHGLEEEMKQVSSYHPAEAQIHEDTEESIVDDLMMPSLEWDGDDLIKCTEESMEIGFDASPSTERESSSGFESGSKMVDSCTSMQTRTSWACWSSEESGLVEFDNAVMPGEENPTASSDQFCSSNASEMSTPSDLTSADQVMNVGHQINVHQYAFQEWQGDTVKAQRILQGYSQIPSMLGLQNIRKIRGDNYCGIRAAIFQTLSQGLPVPSGAETFQCLANGLHTKEGWLKDWTFAGRLPYHGSNVLEGMKECLRTLDNVASHLSSVTEGREEQLMALFNNDPNVDLHIVEAVKLHMLRCAMQLHKLNVSRTDEVPLFAILMFARDTSQTPRDLMNNHLREVGNSGGLEQVEMILLGYTLGVILRVVRPSAYGTEDFLCSYPDCSEGNCPQVFLVAEDDRHYNVLVN